MDEIPSSPPAHSPPPPSSPVSVPFDRQHASVFSSSSPLTGAHLRAHFIEACRAWLLKSPSLDTRTNYTRDVNQFLSFLGVSPAAPEQLAAVTPGQVAGWRDSLRQRGLTNSSIRRKLTALRSLYSYLKSYGYAGANPAHSDFVDAPAVPRDGKTVALSPEDCRRFLDAPDPNTPQGVRDRALLAVLAYTGCRVGELTRLSVGSYKRSEERRVGKECRSRWSR